MKTKAILLCSVALTLGACSAQSGSRYMPRTDASPQNYTKADRIENRMDTKAYKQYEKREPCQYYRNVPQGMLDRCAQPEPEEKVVLVATPAPRYIEPKQEQKQEPKALPIVRSYTILFDHDKSDIRGNEHATLDRAMREIDQYQPTQVTVTGYTDSSGSADYNHNLSREREQAVSQALLRRGIKNQTLEREARGQYDQAVQTEDGVRNQENRRVVIDFRR